MPRLMMECAVCGHTDWNMKVHCYKSTRPFTGGQAFKREDKWYSWKFFIAGNQRSKGTDRHGKAADAIADFNEVISYTIPE